MRYAIYEYGYHDKSYTHLYYRDDKDENVFDKESYHRTMARKFLKKEYANQAFTERCNGCGKMFYHKLLVCPW
jgi:hypothetical protein